MQWNRSFWLYLRTILSLVVWLVHVRDTRGYWKTIRPNCPHRSNIVHTLNNILFSFFFIVVWVKQTFCRSEHILRIPSSMLWATWETISENRVSLELAKHFPDTILKNNRIASNFNGYDYDRVFTKNPIIREEIHLVFIRCWPSCIYVSHSHSMSTRIVASLFS